MWPQTPRVLRQTPPVLSFPRQLAAIPAASGQKQSVSSQPEGKPAPEGQASQQSQAQAAKAPKRRGGRRGEKTVPSGSKLPPPSSEPALPGECSYTVFIPLPPSPEAAQVLKSRPEAFWSVLKEPQKTVLAGYSSEPSHFLPPIYKGARPRQCHPLQTPSVVSRERWP